VDRAGRGKDFTGFGIESGIDRVPARATSSCRWAASPRGDAQLELHQIEPVVASVTGVDLQPRVELD